MSFRETVAGLLTAARVREVGVNAVADTVRTVMRNCQRHVETHAGADSDAAAAMRYGAEVASKGTDALRKRFSGPAIEL